MTSTRVAWVPGAGWQAGPVPSSAGIRGSPDVIVFSYFGCVLLDLKWLRSISWNGENVISPHINVGTWFLEAVCERLWCRDGGRYWMSLGMSA